MIKQGTEGRKGRATEIPGGGKEEPQKCLLGGGEGDKSHKNTSLEYSSVPGTRFSKVPLTYRAREAVLLSFRRRVDTTIVSGPLNYQDFREKGLRIRHIVKITNIYSLIPKTGEGGMGSS